MPSAFQTMARARLQPAYAHHRQPFVWRPMARGPDVNDDPGDDPSRAGGVVQGCFFDRLDRRQHPDVHDPRADQRPGSNDNIPRVEFPPPLDGAPPDVRALDELTDENGQAWRVVEVWIKKSGVLVAEVNAI